MRESITKSLHRILGPIQPRQENTKATQPYSALRRAIAQIVSS